jgi:hypothetical protein
MVRARELLGLAESPARRRNRPGRHESAIPKGGDQFSEKIMLKQEDKA